MVAILSRPQCVKEMASFAMADRVENEHKNN